MSKIKKAARRATPLSEQDEIPQQPEHWLEPITESAPCGPNLEYDNEYVTLLARMAPQADVQYGSFTEKPALPDWNDIERECRRLLLRSKDLTVLIWLMRCRTRLGGATGMHEALEMLARTLARYPEAIHPQLIVEGEHDPAMRANALAALCDPEGFLSDLREIVVCPHTASRLTVRDVERAFAVPRLADALPLDAVRRQLHDLQTQGDSTVLALANASALLRQIDQRGRDSLGAEAPNIQVILRLIDLFEVESADAPTGTPPAATTKTEETRPTEAAVISSSTRADELPQRSRPHHTALATDSGHTTPIERREQVRESLRAAREWLELCEPSSPVALLLKQADRLLGKRFAEVVQAIPPDLLAKWDAE